MRVLPLAPRREQGREEVQLDATIGQFPDDRLSQLLVPEGQGLAVVHDLVAAIQEAGRSEGGLDIVELAAVRDACAAERAVGQRDRLAAEDVVRHLVRVHDAERICPVLPVDRHAEDALVTFEVVGLFGGDAGRELQWRYAVGRDAAPLDLKRLDARGLLVALQELLESGMDACEEAALELRVAVGRTVLIQVCADPLEP